MGEIAEDTISGLKCSWCGVYFENEHYYPVACKSCWEDALKDVKNGKIKDVMRKKGKIVMISGVQKTLKKEL